MRQHLSCYVWTHYADMDPAESQDAGNGSVVRILEQGFELESSGGPIDSVSAGPCIDIGCGPGRTTIAVADKTEQITIGIDLNFSMLRLASNLLRSRHVSYPRRRVGLVYDRREFEVQFPRLELVDFWACDALALPFPDRLFGRAIGMNVLDSVSSPHTLLRSIANVLVPGGSAILACPYDWTASVTPVESWIGGHSQRNLNAGECEPFLRRLMTEPHPDAGESEPILQWVSELDHLPWAIRMHDRSTMQYHVHLVHARRLF
ncbi:MAG: methyltransferase domain-containing protein [Pirellula sp.]